MKSNRPLIVLALMAMVWSVPATYANPATPIPGWQDKSASGYKGYFGENWSDDYGIATGKCNREKIATVLGGVLGGFIGSTVGDDDGKAVAVIIGSVLGAFIGKKVGRELDNADRGCLGHALEIGKTNQTVTWANKDNGLSYAVTPLEGYKANGYKCRNYILNVNGKGLNDAQRESACQTGDGTWKTVSK